MHNHLACDHYFPLLKVLQAKIIHDYNALHLHDVHHLLPDDYYDGHDDEDDDDGHDVKHNGGLPHAMNLRDAIRLILNNLSYARLRDEAPSHDYGDLDENGLNDDDV